MSGSISHQPRHAGHRALTGRLAKRRTVIASTELGTGMTLLQVLTNVGVSAATAGVVVIGAGKLFAAKWLELRIAKNLEGVKLEGQKRLEAMKQ